MFEGRRHVTSGVRERIGPDTQVLIWGLIDSLRASSVRVDYFQVFDLEPAVDGRGRPVQKVVHRQERPEYRREHLFPVGRPVRARLFAVDSGDGATLMLADEY